MEVAGLVLGAIPLCSKALSELNSTVDKVRRFTEWRCEIPQYVAQLNGQRVALILTLESLLKSVGHDGADLSEISGDPKHELWQDQSIVDKLRSRHGEAYESIEAGIRKLRMLVERLAHKLGLKTDLQTVDLRSRWIVPQVASGKGSSSNVGKRLRYSVSRKEIMELLTEMHQTQQSIDALYWKSEYVSGTKASANSPGNTSFRMLRDHAYRLHEALTNAVTCTQHQHIVRLQLEQRLLDDKGHYLREEATKRESYGILFSAADSDEWEFAEVEIVNDDGAGNSRTKQTPARPRMKQVQDLCTAVRRPSPESTWCAGFQLDLKVGESLQGTYLPDAQELEIRRKTCGPASGLITLKQLLSRANRPGRSQQYLSEKDRRWLSLTLSASVLQFHASPWMTSTLSKGDISFVYETTSSVVRPWDVRFPLICCNIVSTGRTTRNRHNISPAPPRPELQKQESRLILIKLAILLMEIGFGESLESHQTDEDLGRNGLPNDFTPLLTLQRWRIAKQDDLSAAYYNALQYCIAGYLDLKLDFDKDKWIESAIQNVILPLDEEYRAFVG